ncbi:uncharacterized protein AKAME5_001585600 [Lates japonicus]|uniref:Uncharacterized protein n=1 Tax=Lates japonicus TaxID=270547 RepID=A0AAD3N013_LATJO|nr:uncharacterized protein AKAME5_001585600 [Lates japonicus]
MQTFSYHFIHSYHDRHQATHYPLYYEQQDQGREASYWTVPGSRTGGAPQDYTNWTDPELSAPASSHFPFILDRHTQQHQDLGEYQLHEARDREWTATHRAAREYERGFLREGWQRRWEPCSPVRYNREVSTKRSDSSYRELEAWAARYSHSLPRRRRIEAELRGASQGLLESSRAPERDSRSGTDPRVAALQHVRQSANIRESGVWERGGRQQTPNYYPPQPPAPNASHMLDVKGKTGYQRRMFSQPPGYIAPPPYNNPHKSSPVMHHCDTSWEQEGKRQTYWSQPTLRKQDVSVDLQDKRKAEKEDFTKPDGNKTTAELDGLKNRGPETDTAGSPINVQNTHMQHECMLSLQQPQTIQPVQNIKTNEQTSSKVIEGRKFRLNKKTGGMTIFCLVSRIAGPTETPSLPLCTSQTNIQSTELGEVSKGLRDSGDDQTQKLADEVDFRPPALKEQSNTSDARNLKAKQQETPTCAESEILGDNLSNKAETDDVSAEKNNLNDANSTSGKQVAQSVQPISVKYPLWREPSFTSRAETEVLSTLLKTNSEEGESDGSRNQEDCAAVHPINVEVRRLDIKNDTESEDSKGLLVIDTTCVVVKMELIPSPKKEHVHYLGSTSHTEDSPPDTQSNSSPESNTQLDQDVIPNTETNPLQINDRPETELDSDLVEKKATEGGGDTSFPCMPSSSISERETLEERAERILGIPLHNCITEQQPDDATSFLEPCVEEQDEEVEPSPVTNDIHNATELPEDTTEEERSQSHLESGQTGDAVCLKESADAEDQVKDEDGEHFAGPQEQVSEEDTDSQLETDVKTSKETKMAEDNLLEPTSDEDTTKQSQEENQPVENDTSSPHPETSSLPSTQQLPSPLLPGSTKSSPSSTPHTDHSPSPTPPLDLMYQTAEAMSCIEDQDEEGETSQPINNDISDTLEDLEDQEVVSEQQFEYEQPDNVACAEESNIADGQQTKEADRDPIDLLEQTLEISTENGIDANILQQQHEYVQVEDVACVRESHMTEEQLQEKANEDPTDLLDQTPEISKENDPDCEVSQIPLDVLSPSELPSPPHTSHKSDTEPVSCLEIDLDCPLALNPATADADIPETAPPPLQLDSCEESPHFSCSSISESAPSVAPTISTPSHVGGEGVSLDLPHKEEPQYPKSLWDAVNRIRKHTAPDSENEEEEVSEQWDPESIGEDFSCPDVVLDMNSERIVFDEAGHHKVSTESIEDVEQYLCHEEPHGHAEEDTLSCSSTSSRSSGDTVIVAEEDEVENTPPDALTESKTGTSKELPVAEGEQCGSGEVKDETAEEEGDDEQDGDTKEFCLSEECTVEVENITAEATEMLETEREESEEEGFTPSEVTLVSDEVTGGDCTAVGKESESVT